MDLKEILRITYSVELVCHLHQLLVHLDPDVLALKHSGQREQITREASAVTCCNNRWMNVSNSSSTCPTHDSSLNAFLTLKCSYNMSTLALSLKIGVMSVIICLI